MKRRRFLIGATVVGAATVAGCGLGTDEVLADRRMTVATALATTGRFDLQMFAGKHTSGFVVFAKDGSEYPFTPAAGDQLMVFVNGVLIGRGVNETMVRGGDIIHVTPVTYNPTHVG